MKKLEKDTLVHQVVEEIYVAYPELWERFGNNGRERTEEDNYHHLDHLSSAFEMESADFFLDYTKWLNNVLTSRGVGTGLIIDNYERIIRLLKNATWENDEERTAFINYLQEGLHTLHSLQR
ncbi:hypothetical protein MUN89_08860 [Halobacillus salinarum]|uniref:Uncharacterized protein n=1 Tax=Halobacillus salinarum TaxID=2932257 RepID=A0ABY4EQ64_9BACI|nr:hypothetical protein [Halobacillus salinarum]UOQ46008.1 hypothetical protein MUN89_08860 [Halobacillus salinarum]